MHSLNIFLATEMNAVYQSSLTLLQHTSWHLCAVSTQLIVIPYLQGPLDLWLYLYTTDGSTYHVAHQALVLSGKAVDIAVTKYLT